MEKNLPTTTTTKLTVCVVDDLELCGQLLRDYFDNKFSDLIGEFLEFTSDADLLEHINTHKTPIDFFIVDFYLRGTMNYTYTGVDLIVDLLKHDEVDFSKSVFAIVSAEQSGHVKDKAASVLPKDTCFFVVDKINMLHVIGELLTQARKHANS